MSSLTDLPAGERPRERLNALGPGALAASELMALLVGSGGRGASALGIAGDVLGKNIRTVKMDAGEVTVGWGQGITGITN